MLSDASEGVGQLLKDVLCFLSLDELVISLGGCAMIVSVCHVNPSHPSRLCLDNL